MTGYLNKSDRSVRVDYFQIETAKHIDRDVDHGHVTTGAALGLAPRGKPFPVLDRSHQIALVAPMVHRSTLEVAHSRGNPFRRFSASSSASAARLPGCRVWLRS